MATRPLTVAWFSFFPVEWLPDAPEEVRRLPRLHPASWQRVLLDQLAGDPTLRLHVIVLRKKLERDFTFERNGVVFHLVKVPGGLRAPSLYWVDTFLIRRVLEWIKPDVVHAWGTEQGAALVASRLGYPSVVTIQGLMIWYGQVVPLGWQQRLAGLIERYSLPRSPVVTTESNFSVQWLRQRFPQIRVEQIEHAPAPVFHRVVRRPQTQPVRLLVVGALDYRKGGDLLILALDQLREEIDFELVVVGKLESDVAKLVQGRVSVELWRRVVFKENLSPPQVADELAVATLAVCASRADVSPNAVKEAVVAGVPVVGSAVGGIPDYVVPGQNGILFAPGQMAELAGALRAACGHSLFRAGKVEAAILGQLRTYLAPEMMGRKFRGIYLTLDAADGRCPSRLGTRPFDRSE